MSSMRCEQCVELVALSVLCVQRPGERRGSQTCLGIFVPPSLPGVRFVPRFGLGELRRFTKSEATITTILTANLPFGSSALDVFRLPGPPQAALGRQRASRARTNDRKTSLPFIASGFTLRFSLLCSAMSGGSAVLGIPATSTVCAGLLFGFWSSLGSGASLSARRVGLQVTMDGGGALQGTGVCVARAPFGARLPPLPAENLEISPPRLLHCSRGSHSLRHRARHLCARGAGLTRRRSPTIGRASTSGCVQNPVWASPGRRSVPVPRMSG